MASPVKDTGSTTAAGSRIVKRVVVAAALLLLSSSNAYAADASKPHGHKGLLKAYARPPAALKLSDAERALLATGAPVMRQTEADAGGRGMAVFRVHTPADVAWATIADFKAYPSNIAEVKEIEVYKKSGGDIDARFKIGAYGVKLEYFIHHMFDMEHHWGTWTLDYSKESDLDDSVGFWRVTEVEGEPEWCTVEYSVDLLTKGWVPGFIKGMLVDSGLQTATKWVRKASEKRYAQMKKDAPTAPPTVSPTVSPTTPPATVPSATSSAHPEGF